MGEYNWSLILDKQSNGGKRRKVKQVKKRVRHYLVYQIESEDYGLDEITLSFGSETSVNQHITNQNIDKSRIFYLGKERPRSKFMPTNKELHGLEELLYHTHPSLNWR